MKKVSALLMAFVLVMSSMCAVGATETGTSEGVIGNIGAGGGGGGIQAGGGGGGPYPFVFEDFEKDEKGPLNRFNSVAATCVEEGAGASQKSAKVKITAASYADMRFAVADTAKVGDTLYMSAWVRPENTDVETKNLSFIMFGTATVRRTSDDTTLPEIKTVNTWNQVYVRTVLRKGEWMKVAAEIPWTGKASATIPAGYNNMTEKKNGTVEEDIRFTQAAIRVDGTSCAAETVDAVEYLIDDFEYYATTKLAAADEDTNIFQNSGMDTAKTGWSMENLSTIVQDANDPAPDGSAGYAKIEPPSEGAKIYGAVGQNVTVKPNHLYKVSFWAKLISAPEGITTGGAWFLQYANKRILDPNGIETNYPGHLIYDCLTLGEWKKIEFYYMTEYKTFVQQQLTTLLRLFAGRDKDNTQCASYGIDNFRCEDLGAVSNGDFSVAEGGIGRNNVYGNVNSPLTEYDVFSWMEQGTTASVTDGAAVISVDTDGGQLYQGINLDNDTLYQFSFRAKGEGDSIGKPVAVKLDRYVETASENELYVVPDYQYIAGTNNAVYTGETYTEDVKANQEWILTDAWQTYTGYYETAFPLKDGAEKTDGIIPRLPFMSVEVDGNKAGTSFMLDDVTVKKVSKKPTLSDVQVVGDLVPGNEVYLQYQYSSPEGVPMQNVLVKMQMDSDEGYISIGNKTGYPSIEIPEHAFGKDLRFELIPVDENLTMGNPVYVDARAPEGAWGKVYYNRKSDTARAYYTEDAKAEILVATYKGGQLTGVELAPVSITACEQAEHKVTTLPTADADDIKVMLWNSAEGGKPMADVLKVDCSEPPEVNLFLLGDSLCADYQITSYPQQGWGYYLQEFFGEKATVRNYAVGGRTAVATYFEEKAWPTVKELAEEGDYLILALGLNDTGSKADNYDPELTDKPTKYKKYLNLICDEAQAMGMTVIFNTLTPTIPQNNAIPRQDTWKTWCNYVMEVAEAQGCVCLDVNTPLRKIYFYDEALGKETEEKGDESYSQYFLSPAAMERFQEYPISDEMLERAATYGDWTHVNEDGAWLIAETIADLLAKSESPLKEYLK